MGGAMLDGFLRSDSFSPSDISISNPIPIALLLMPSRAYRFLPTTARLPLGATLCSSWLSRGSWRALSRR